MNSNQQQSFPFEAEENELPTPVKSINSGAYAPTKINIQIRGRNGLESIVSTKIDGH